MESSGCFGVFHLHTGLGSLKVPGQLGLVPQVGVVPVVGRHLVPSKLVHLTKLDRLGNPVEISGLMVVVNVDLQLSMALTADVLSRPARSSSLTKLAGMVSIFFLSSAMSSSGLASTVKKILTSFLTVLYPWGQVGLLLHRQTFLESLRSIVGI